MPTPRERKTVRGRILGYAPEIGWKFMPRARAVRRQGLTEGGFSNPPLRGKTKDGQECPPSVAPPAVYFVDLLHAKVREFNPKYKEADGTLTGMFQRRTTFQTALFCTRLREWLTAQLALPELDAAPERGQPCPRESSPSSSFRADKAVRTPIASR